MKQSKFLTIGWRDLAHAFLTALIAFVLEFLEKILIPSLDIPMEFKLMLAYLIKKFFQKPHEQKMVAATESDGAGTPNKGL